MRSDLRQDLLGDWRRFQTDHPPRALDVGGVEWSYYIAGWGEPLILLPGGLRFGDAWFRLVSELSATHRILAPTYPPLSRVEDYVEGVEALLRHEGVEQADWLGTSLGGCIAQCSVRRYGDRVRRLILVSTMPPGPLAPWLFDLRATLVSWYPAALVRWLTVLETLWLLSPPAEDKSFWRFFLREKLEAVDVKAGAVAMARTMADYARNYEFSAADLRSWDGEVLIIDSDDDPVVRTAWREALRSLYPQARTHTVNGLGHGFPYTHPMSLVKVL